MEFNTFIFEESQKKKKEIRKDNFQIAMILLAGILVALFLFRFGAIISIIPLIFGLVTAYSIHSESLKRRGINAYGSQKARLTIAEDYLMIRDTQILFSEVKNLIIYVDEYTGMPKEIGTYHGGNNEITFEHNGEKYSIKYVIPSREEYRFVEKLVDKIELKYGKLI